MDVRFRVNRAAFGLKSQFIRVGKFCRILVPGLCLFALSCGKNMDIDTAYGRQARVDETNQLLSKGYCQLALDTITPLHDVVAHRTDEVVILKAASYACFSGFTFLGLADNLASVSNKFAAMAKSVSASGSSDTKISYMFSAVDTLSSGGTVLSAAQRGTKLNSYMVFLQLGLMGSILSAYGAPGTTSGTQVTDLQYSVTAGQGRQAGDMLDAHACALMTALSTIVDSFANAGISGNADLSASVSSFNSICTSAGTSCTSLSKDRSTCDGLAADPESVIAGQLVTQVNSGW